MAAPVILYIDTTNKVQIANFLSSQQATVTTVLEAGDTVPMQLHFLQKNPSVNTSGSTISQLPYAYIDPTTVTPVTLAIGAIGTAPTAGTFTVTFGANTTSALAYNVSAAGLSTALNALASVTTAGGVTVTGNAGGPYRISFNTVGVQSSMFAVNATVLSPTSLGITAQAVTGTASIAEVEVIRLIQNPAAVQSTWTAVAGAMTVTRLQAGGSGQNEIQRVTVPQGTYAGGFSLAFGAANSGSLVYNITAAAMQTALQAMSTIGANNCSVIQSSSVTWDITFTGTLGGLSQSLITANSAGLSMPAYLSANVNLNTQAVFDFLSTVNSASATLQIQQGSSVNTVLQTTVTLQNTLIQGTPATPVPSNPWQTLTQVNALIAAAAYVLPASTTTTLGGVIVPAAGRLSVDGSGNISVPLSTASVFGVVKPDTTTITISAGVISAVAYVLPTATASVLGGVKPDGTTITISAGVISAVAYTLPTATTSVLGGVKIDGTTITIASGVISTSQDLRTTANPQFGNTTSGYTKFTSSNLFIAAAGGDYPSLGYNYVPTSTAGVYNYVVGDLACRIEFYNGGYIFKTAATGTAGNPITFSNKVTIDVNGNLIMGNAALATTATNGFFYSAGGAGAPTGAPTAFTGRYPFYYDSTNNKIWVYNGSWRGVVVA